MLLAALLLLLEPSWARNPEPTPEGSALVVPSGVTTTRLDLWRPWEGADKVLVPARLSDGSTELFVVDTGAVTSVLMPDVAKRLGLDATEDGGMLQGLSGTVAFHRGVLPRLKVGDFELEGIEVAVGVPGVEDHLGVLPIGGILGNNVWTNFVCEFDYPRDELTLTLGSAHKPRGRAAELRMVGNIGVTPVRLTAAGPDGQTVSATVPLEVDTGAHDLLLVGSIGEPFRAVSTVGEEPVLGVGADLDELPDRRILRPTRRVHTTQLRAGGHTLDREVTASWLCADGECTDLPHMPGLLGFSAFGEHRVVLDFPYRRFQVLPAPRGDAQRTFDALEAWLALPPNPGEDPVEHLGDRLDVLMVAGHEAQARTEVEAALGEHPDAPALVVRYAALLRGAQEWDRAIEALSKLSSEALLEEHNWVTYVGSLILAGRREEALSRAEAALAAAPIDSEHREELYVALSDALLALGRHDAAAVAIENANAASQRGTSAHLLRKARIATAANDRYGAMVALRSLVEVIPLRGQPVWWYATLVQPADRATFAADVDAAMRRLHPEDRPYDFLGAAWRAVGEEAKGEEALLAGTERDCAPLPEGADQDNCRAWYLALRGKELGQAKVLIDKAIAAHPYASGYLDTAAMVALAGGDRALALRYATQAARLDPSDPYLLWQLDRLSAAPPPPGAHP